MLARIQQKTDKAYTSMLNFLYDSDDDDELSQTPKHDRIKLKKKKFSTFFGNLGRLVTQGEIILSFTYNIVVVSGYLGTNLITKCKFVGQPCLTTN